MEHDYQLFIVLAILIFYSTFKYLSKPLAFVSSYILTSALISSIFPQLLNNYFSVDAAKSSQFILMEISSKALIALAITLLAPISLISLVPHIAIADCAYTLYRHFAFPSLGPGYAMGLCPTMDGVFIGLMYPYTVKFALSLKSINPIRYLYLLLPPSIIFMVHGSTGVGILALSLFIINYSKLSKHKFLMPILIISPVIILYTANKFFPVFRDHHRLQYWILFIKFFSEHANHWFGFGLGTFSSLGPLAIMQEKLPELMLEAHNDWLQCLFEMGIVGLTLSVSFILYIIYRARHNIYLLASILSYSAAAFFYYPVHNPILGAFAVILIKLSLDEHSTRHFILDRDDYISNH